MEPTMRFPWAQLSSAMAEIRDWPTCFSASLNAIRGQFSYPGLMDGEPWIKEAPVQNLQRSATELGVDPEKYFNQVLRSQVSSSSNHEGE